MTVGQPVTKFDFSESSTAAPVTEDFIKDREEATQSGAYEKNTSGMKTIVIILKSFDRPKTEIFAPMY